MPRVTVFAIVEGQTENSALKKLLGAHLGALGIDFHTPIIRMGRSRGGVKYLHVADLCEQVRRFMLDPRQPVVTTFFDYYAFPTGTSKGWEFVAHAKATAQGIHATVQAIETELRRLVLRSVGDVAYAERRFIPYLQLHELEALFFSEPKTMATVFENPALEKSFANIVSTCGGCELINDSPQTAPSKRIEKLCPGYVKGRSELAHGPRIAGKLDLVRVRKECLKFSLWVKSLEQLINP